MSKSCSYVSVHFLRSDDVPLHHVTRHQGTERCCIPLRHIENDVMPRHSRSAEHEDTSHYTSKKKGKQGPVASHVIELGVLLRHIMRHRGRKCYHIIRHLTETDAVLSVLIPLPPPHTHTPAPPPYPHCYPTSSQQYPY